MGCAIPIGLKKIIFLKILINLFYFVYGYIWLKQFNAPILDLRMQFSMHKLDTNCWQGVPDIDSWINSLYVFDYPVPKDNMNLTKPL